MQRFIDAWAAFVVRFRWPIVIVLPVAALLLSAPAANIYFAHSAEMWFVEDDPVNRDYQALKRRFGDTQYLLVGVAAGDGGSVLRPQALEALRELHDFLLEHEQVADVQSLVNFQYIGAADDELTITDLLDRDAPAYSLAAGREERRAVAEALSGQPLVLGDLVTEDLEHTVILAETFYDESGRIGHHVELVDDLEDFIDVQQYAAKGIEVHVFGRPYISRELTRGNVRDQIVFYPLLLLLTTLLFIAMFRRVRPLFAPWLVIGLGVSAVYTVQGLLGWPTTVANASMPFLIIIIGIGMSAHVIVAHYRALAGGAEGREAARESIRELFRPALFSTVTTLFGFLGLAFTYLDPIREYGLLAIVGVGSCFVLSMTLLPAFMSFDRRAPGWALREREREGRTLVERVTARVALAPRAVALAGAGLAAVSLALTASLEMDANFVHIFKRDSEFRAAFDYFDREFQGGQAIEIVLDSGEEGGVYDVDFLRQVDELNAWLDGIESLGKPSSLVGYVKQMNRSLNGDEPSAWRLPDGADQVAQLLLLYENAGPERSLRNLIDPDRRHLRVTVRASNLSAVRTRELVERVQGEIGERWPELDAVFTGDLILYNRLENHIATGIATSFGVALLTIGTCLFLLFRKPLLTAIALAASVFPIFVGGAVMKLLGIYPDINSLIIASVCVGIAVDDTIHFLVRYEAARAAGHAPRESIRRASREAGKAILLSTVVLVLGFSIFLLSSLMSGVYFGLLSMIVIAFALIGDTVLLPALLLLLERRADAAEDARRAPAPALVDNTIGA